MNPPILFADSSQNADHHDESGSGFAGRAKSEPSSMDELAQEWDPKDWEPLDNVCLPPHKELINNSPNFPHFSPFNRPSPCSHNSVNVFSAIIHNGWMRKCSAGPRIGMHYWLNPEDYWTYIAD